LAPAALLLEESMSKQAIRSLAPVAMTWLAAGCANPPWQPPAYETAIQHYYEAHASEKNGRCWAPYIDGFTAVQVVEDTPARMVVDAGYLYRDRVKDGQSIGDGEGSECVGYGHRNFVLAESDDTLQVTEMSGLRRN
jgi:hypothetical protein